MGLSSLTRVWTWEACVGAWSLSCWITRAVLRRVCLKFQEAATLFPRRPQLWLQAPQLPSLCSSLMSLQEKADLWVGFLGTWRPSGDHGSSRKMPRRGDWKAWWKAPQTPSTGWAGAQPSQDPPRAGPRAWLHRSYPLHPRWWNCLPESLGLPPTPTQVMFLGWISQLMTWNFSNRETRSTYNNHGNLLLACRFHMTVSHIDRVWFYLTFPLWLLAQATYLDHRDEDIINFQRT